AEIRTPHKARAEQKPRPNCIAQLGHAAAQSPLARSARLCPLNRVLSVRLPPRPPGDYQSQLGLVRPAHSAVGLDQNGQVLSRLSRAHDQNEPFWQSIAGADRVQQVGINYPSKRSIYPKVDDPHFVVWDIQCLRNFLLRVLRISNK